MKYFLFSFLLLILCSCGLKPKHQKTLIGAAAGGLIAGATTSPSDNEAVAISGGAAVGALVTWGVLTYWYEEDSFELQEKNNKLQQQLNLLEKVQNNDPSLKKTKVEKWVPVSETDQEKKLKFINQEYEESRP